MKIYLIFLLLLIPLVSATEYLECSRHGQAINEIPCIVQSSYRPLNCTGEIKIYRNNTLIQNISWYEAVPFCEFSWNISSPIATYTYNSTIESGMVTLSQRDEDTNLLGIIALQIFLVAFYIIIGLPHKVGFVKFIAWGLGIIELMVTIWIVYLNEAGASITEFLYLNSIINLILGSAFGIFTLIIMMVKLSNPGKESNIKDDGYTKYVFPK